MRLQVLVFTALAACTQSPMEIRQVTVIAVEVPTPAPPSVHLTVNGLRGSVVLHAGEPYSADWTSTGARTCESISPVRSGVELQGYSGLIRPGDPSYPTQGKPVVVIIECSNNSAKARDSVVVRSSLLALDLRVNGQKTALVNGEPFTYSWTSSGAKECKSISPDASGVKLSGSGTVDAKSSWYPAKGKAVTLVFACSDDISQVVDAVTVFWP